MCSRRSRALGLPIYVARLPRLHSLVATLATLPSILEIPFLDCSFAIISSKIGCRVDTVQSARLLVWLTLSLPYRAQTTHFCRLHASHYSFAADTAASKVNRSCVVSDLCCTASQCSPLRAKCGI